MLLNTINVMYINLDTRIDRNIHVVNEFKKINVLKPERFKAIKLDNGALGCSMSHLKCIEHAKRNNYKYTLVCEDDIEFLNPELFLSQLQSFLKKERDWDVILIAGNNMLPYKSIDETCIQVYNCQTTTGYIVKNEYYDTLIKNYKDGIQKQLKEPENNDYKIDKHWFHLQRKDKWFLIVPLTIIQREDYSDIEKKVTNFKNFMLNYNKCYKM
jgi:GR25 family glycosyltransferase involved in LPS biosynthesis